MPENWSNCAPLAAPVGAFSEKERGIANDGSKRPSRCGITPEHFRFIDENFLNDLRVGYDQDIRQACPDACDALLVSTARNRLNVVAQQRSQAEQAERSFRRKKWNEIGIGKHAPHQGSNWSFS